ncbi:FkbM family methyltransferase [Azorhizobium sp. AG788]|uniref:FkbM family methyltransferase n=1 Tax=Azorhizobium sp. AG788 TaxID=2183897 RepID=UPI00105F5353|nr:FkbM family methyltransferase [Azorhizobium sp. AG788]TDU01049.1 FkbM family methyltransferase [Azorhizobium sp. AG788]
MHEHARQLLASRLERPLQLVDVGARWGANPVWAPLGDLGRILCFEPEPEECARLNAARPPNVEYLPVGLGGTIGTATLHVTKEPGCSSVFPPVPELVANYPCLDIMAEERTIEFPCTTLDEALSSRGITTIAAIKLDTQGSELQILKGGIETLKTCHMVDVEVEFNPLYTGQALFCDVDRFLRDQGFALWRLDNLSHYAPEHVPLAGQHFWVSGPPAGTSEMSTANGQLFWSQARYVRATYPRTGAPTLDMAKALPAAVISSLYNYWDLSLELIRKTGDVDLYAALRAALQMPV